VVLALTFLALILLRVALLTVGGLLLVRPVRGCPACFQPTAPVRVRWLPWTGRFEWRWCMGCGWRGLSLRAPERTPERMVA
jgi:hypothetical protein